MGMVVQFEIQLRRWPILAQVITPKALANFSPDHNAEGVR